MLNKVKLALRISHNLLDSDIQSTIDVARAELIRSGVSKEKAESEDSLIESAIKTYCLFVHANDDKRAQGFFESWQYQLDNLRKSIEYTEGSDS
jgi:uncharacterized phage protein (predicted DNA packaging)